MRSTRDYADFRKLSAVPCVSDRFIYTANKHDISKKESDGEGFSCTKKSESTIQYRTTWPSFSMLAGIDKVDRALTKNIRAFVKEVPMDIRGY